MASCLVPDFPAVTFALEHLKELDKQLNEGGVPFSREASLHLTEVAAAVTELEADRHAAREHLEVETIENSKLRHRINNIREELGQDIVADAAAARASNAEEMEHLQKELDAVSRTQEATAKRQEALLSQNRGLCAERELARAEHGETVAALNDQIAVKYGLQMRLDQTAQRLQELKSRGAAVAREKATLRRSATPEREAFAVKRDDLAKEEDRLDGELKRLRRAVARRRRESDRVSGRKQRTLDRLKGLAIRKATLEGNLRTQAASRCRRVERLEGETQRRQELEQQRDRLGGELCALRGDLGVTVRRLKGETATVQRRIEEEQASRYLCQDSVVRSWETLERQRGEEREARAEHLRVSRRLERSARQLEELVASAVERRAAIGEMDARFAELREVGAIDERAFARGREEMRVNADAEERNVGRSEEEKKRLRRLLAEAEKRQEEHAEKVTRDIDGIRRRYRDLRREEAALLLLLLQQQQPMSPDADSLMSRVAQCEAEYRGEEARLRREIERCAAEAETAARSAEEKQREAEEMEEMLRGVEARWSEERSRRRRLEAQTSALRRERGDLELSIRASEERSGSPLEPRKEMMRAELEEARERHVEVLRRQASELRAAVRSVYDGGVKLEQVRAENSRLHLRVRQMTDDVSRARRDKDRYRREGRRVGRDTRALIEGLRDAWREDVLVTEDRLSSDAALLGSMSAAVNSLQTRSQRFGNVGSLLHQLMSDFSKQLG